MKYQKHYSMSDLRSSMTPEKKAADGIWTRLVLRPLSFPVSWLFLRLGLSPNGVTYLSALFCLLGILAFLLPSGVFAWLGFFLFFAFGVLDCADGNMARVSGKTSRWGEWVDALGGYTAYSTFLLGIGLLSDTSTGSMLPGLGAELPWTGGWTLVGAVAALANLFMRTVFQNYRAVQLAIPGGVKQNDERAGIGAEKKLSETIGITGFLVPAAALGYVSGFLPWVVGGYAVLYGGACLVMVLRLIVRVERELVKGAGN